eukprot:15455270-Alexandrium_andersonii.AAC.1
MARAVKVDTPLEDVIAAALTIGGPDLRRARLADDFEDRQAARLRALELREWRKALGLAPLPKADTDGPSGVDGPEGSFEVPILTTAKVEAAPAAEADAPRPSAAPVPQ